MTPSKSNPISHPRFRTPFPWFGGKSRVAHLVWPRFGDLPNYLHFSSIDPAPMIILHDEQEHRLVLHGWKSICQRVWPKLHIVQGGPGTMEQGIERLESTGFKENPIQKGRARQPLRRNRNHFSTHGQKRRKEAMDQGKRSRPHSGPMADVRNLALAKRKRTHTRPDVRPSCRRRFNARFHIELRIGEPYRTHCTPSATVVTGQSKRRRASRQRLCPSQVDSESLPLIDERLNKITPGLNLA